MKSSLKLLAFCSLLSTTALSQELSLNMPIIQTKYTADPAPIVYNDTVYLFTSHDEDDGENFHMKDWLLYTSTDMVNWQDRGAVASLKDFSNGTKATMAPGHSKWFAATANGICIAPFMATASACWCPTLLTALLKIP